MSKGKTRELRWVHLGRSSCHLSWASLHAPWLTRAYWPRVKVGLPSYPTIGGKRRASRDVVRRMWVDIRQSNRHRPRTMSLEALASRWVALQVPTARAAMRRYAEFMAMSNEEKETTNDL